MTSGRRASTPLGTSCGTLPAGTGATVLLDLRDRALEVQKRIGWEVAVRIDKIIATVLHVAHKRQVEEAPAP